MATHVYKCMMNVKKEILSLMATYISVVENPVMVVTHFIPPLIETVLGEYAVSSPAAREVEVLNLMAEIFNKLKESVIPYAPRILSMAFEPTLSMITASGTSDEYPEHRLAFFKLLEAMNTHCFTALAIISSAQLSSVLAAVVWAFKHMSRETGETGLNILMQLLINMSGAGHVVAQPFLQNHTLTYEQYIKS